MLTLLIGFSPCRDKLLTFLVVARELCNVLKQLGSTLHLVPLPMVIALV